MNDADLPAGTIFVDRDPGTGEAVPTSFRSIDDLLQRDHPNPEHLPAEIREQLETARQYFAMAYDQSNSGRLALYPTLVGDSFVKAMRAFEMALNQRLGCNPKTALANMIKLAQARGILPTDAELEQRGRGLSHVWTILVKTRNDIVHGNPDPEMFGPATAHLFGFLLRTITELFPEPGSESVAP